MKSRVTIIGTEFAMYTRVLAAVNEHLNSEISARYALSLARVCGAKLYICFIAEKGMSRSGFDSAEEAMKRLFNQAVSVNMRVQSVTGTGEPLREIERIVRSEKIDLVFASTRREDVDKRFYAGTIARSFSLCLPCSVALVRVVHMGRVRPKKILLPLKARISHIRERAYFAAKMAESFEAKVFVLHAAKPITKFFRGELHLTPVEWGKRLPGDIRDFTEYLRKYGVAYEERLTPDMIARSITIEASSKRHDLIIMGASERNLFSSLLKGNPVEDVLRQTPCDLIMLKPKHEDKQSYER